MSEALLLQDYQNEHAYCMFDPTTGAVLSRFGGQDSQKLTPSGFFSERSIGLARRTPAVAAVFAFGDELRLSIGSSQWNLLNLNVKVVRRAIGPFARRFDVLDHESIAFSAKYWFVEWREWPDNGDILSYTERIVRTPETRLEFYYVWMTSQNGLFRPDDQFAAEVQRFVESHASDDSVVPGK